MSTFNDINEKPNIKKYLTAHACANDPMCCKTTIVSVSLADYGTLASRFLANFCEKK